MSLIIAGTKMHRLTAEKQLSGDRWLWRCDCGGEIIQKAAVVKFGNTKSCGCLSRERVAERNTTHGMSKHALYGLWCGMKARCENPKHTGYKNYGGRGISVDSRWQDFTTFVRDMGDRPSGTTLDRKDTDGPYSPENCRWASRRSQALNTRRNVRLEHNGKSLTVAEWAAITGIDQRTLNRRRYLGWSTERILETKIP